jgi:hypothetical protein
MAAGAGSESHSRSPRAASAEEHAVPRQYHRRTSAISAPIGSQIGYWNEIQIVFQNPGHNAADPAGSRKQAQYQRPEPQYQDDGLMLQIGALLGIAYLVFLAIWIWATRFRPH